MKGKLNIINSKKFSFINSVRILSSSVKLRGKLLILLLSLSLFTFSIYAQEVPESEEEPLETEELSETEEPPVEEVLPLTPEQLRTELEIKTSSLPELAAWCRSLGLSEGGTKEELANRLREYLSLPEPKEAGSSNQKLILIESAQTSEYFKIEVTDEDYARLKGGVRISLIDKESTHKIKADEIVFNRTRNILTASGNVEYIKDKDDTTEVFRGQNITVNIDNWSSIFLDGTSIRKLGDENTAYRFEGRVISRSDEEVTVLRDAKVGNASNEEALWSISATRLWLLPGSDFALFNAVLKVGEIPVMYFPFFFYPADDLIFHPVLGYRSREGGYVQTTTYILGRPKVDSSDSNSLSRILGSSNDMEKEHNGIFLRSTGKKIKNPDEYSLKAMVDYYTNLGAYFGTDFSVPRKGILSSLDLSMGVGVSRTVTQIGSSYNPFAPSYDGTSDWNRSNLFSKDVPFRYRMEMNSSISGTYGSLSLSFPNYSDPFINNDFLKRSEFMDWFNMMQQGAAVEDEYEQQKTEIQTQQWQLTGNNFRPQLNFLAPYISNFSISSFTMTLAFLKIIDREILAINSDSPARNFFAPDKFTIYNISSSISGTPLTIGGASTSTTAEKKEEKELDIFKGIGTPRSPWAEEEQEQQEQKKTTGDKLVPPVLNQRFDLGLAGNNKFSINYQLSPTSSTELQFRSGYENWKSYEDIDWGEIQSILSTFSGNGNVTFGFDHTSGFYNNTFTISGSGMWRDFNYLNEEAEAYKTPQNPQGVPDEKRLEDAKKQQYGFTNYSTSYTYNGTIKPLYKNAMFSQSNLSYTFGGTLVRSKKYDGGDGPELTPQWGTWEKEKLNEDIYGLTSHRFSTNLAANVFDYMQNLTLSSDLPPLDPLFSTDMTFRAWISETRMNVQFKKPELINNEENNKWIIDPFNFTETIRYGNFLTYSFYMVTDPEVHNEVTTISTSLTLWNFRASFSARKSVAWEFLPDFPDNPSMGGKWQQKDEEQTLNPIDLNFSYVRSFPIKEIIKNRLNTSLNLDTRLNFDLQRYTNSNFTFSLGFKLGIGGFMDLSLSAASENKVIWRYFKNFPGFEDKTSMYIDGDQNNVFIDLFDSFNFADESKRQRSGFKMKSFNLKAMHFLGDWTAELDITMSPFLNQKLTPPKYELNSEVSFLVKWTAISEIKTDMKYEKRTETWTKR